MALRVFTCKDCGHHMRFSGNHCGKCYCEKTALQQPTFWYVLVGVVAILALLGLLQLLSAGL